MFKPVKEKDFVKIEKEILEFWKELMPLSKLRAMRTGPRWSFVDGPITANNPMGVHHAWGRCYKDLWHRFWAMRGYQMRYQNGFDCQGLWVEVEVEKEKGFKSKRDIETYGLDKFVIDCKVRVLRQAARQTEQSIRLGYWMDWNDPAVLRILADKLEEDPRQVVTIMGTNGPVTGPVEEIVGRLGSPEIGGSYFTFTTENNYTIWTFLKKVWEKGWLYRGHDVMPWCSRCSTALSQHEIVTDGYQELTHDAVILRFPLMVHDKESLLVWTTTPWTLSSNVAVAVGPEINYVKVRSERDGWVYYVAENALKSVLKGKYEILAQLRGEEMLGWTYVGPFDELPQVQIQNAPAYHRVIPWKDVGDTEGTGIVHIAPGCGSEDFQLGKDWGLPAIAPLDENGCFLDGFGWLSGRDVHKVTPDIFNDLEAKGLLYRVEPYTHRYPVCWRCGTPLVFRLVDEWFISMGPVYDKPREEVTPEEKESSLRYQIMDVVEQIKWIPEFGYEREMDWLRNMRDWMISKKRYWGLALPIWVCETCEHFEVIGDGEELRSRAIAGWEEFDGHTPHRPYVDAVKIACSKCGGVMSRIKDVGNPWLDAGSVAYSTLQYRTNRPYWEQWFPAEWISESFPGQFRNWFYSLITMSTVLEKRPPTKIVHGYATLFAEDGRPMHKSWGNAIWFDDAAETMGVDTMRWMYVSQRLDQNMLFGYNRADEVRKRFIIPLWNIYTFFVTYARIDEWVPNEVDEKYRTPLDRWILARLKETVEAMRAGYESYQPIDIAQPAEVFVDDLTNWYIRRNRRRFWATKGQNPEVDNDKNAAYDTLYTVLVAFIKALSPVIPFLTEAMYQNLVRSVDSGALESIHFCLWPDLPSLNEEEKRLIESMKALRSITSLGHFIRATNNIKLKQPLRSCFVFTDPRKKDLLAGMADILADELNVKEIVFADYETDLITYKIVPVSRILGPKYGAKFPRIREALSKTNTHEILQNVKRGQPVTLNLSGEFVVLNPEEIDIQTYPVPGFGVASDEGFVVAMDTKLNEDLVNEYLMREIIRKIQELRKQLNIDITERIIIEYDVDSNLDKIIEQFCDTICNEVLALQIRPLESDQNTTTYQIGEHMIKLKLLRTNCSSLG